MGPWIEIIQIRDFNYLNYLNSQMGPWIQVIQIKDFNYLNYLNSQMGPWIQIIQLIQLIFASCMAECHEARL